VHRETRILLAGGFVLLFATLATVGFGRSPGVVQPITAFITPTNQPKPGPPVVGIVFSPGDCGGLIEQLRLWNEPFLAREARVRGLLMLGDGDRDQLWKVVRGAGLKFPVEAGRGETLAAVQGSLGYRGGSFVVVFDPAGRVRRVTPLADLDAAAARAEMLQFVRSLRVPADGPAAEGA
jgi:hypothetical protein